MKNYRLFIDFDGTITHNDVGNIIFHEFGDSDFWTWLVKEKIAGRISAAEMWRRQIAVSRLTEAQADEFCARQPIDPTFPPFIEFCKKYNIPFHIVSDGMDAYIERILTSHGLGHLPVRANHLVLKPNGEMQVDFPYLEQGCGECANCKGGQIKLLRQPGETTVYIGDGYSDLCGLKEADITFAKHNLLKYCRENGKDCFAWENFQDVQKYLEKYKTG